MNFWGKSENITFLRFLILSYMQKIRKIYRTDFSGKTGRNRETDRDRPKYKGPPDAIANLSDQKVLERVQGC